MLLTLICRVIATWSILQLSLPHFFYRHNYIYRFFKNTWVNINVKNLNKWQGEHELWFAVLDMALKLCDYDLAFLALLLRGFSIIRLSNLLECTWLMLFQKPDVFTSVALSHYQKITILLGIDFVNCRIQVCINVLIKLFDIWSAMMLT